MKKITLKKYIFRCKKQNLITLGWILLGSLCLTSHGLISGQALSAIVALDFKGFFGWILALVMVNLVWSFQLYFVGKMTEKSIQLMDMEIRKDINLHLMNLSFPTFHEKGAGTYQSWLTNDITTINEAGFEVLALMVSQFLNITFSILVLISYHGSLLGTAGIFVVLMLTVPKLFQKKIQESALAASLANENLTQKILDAFKGYDDLFTFGKKSWLLETTHKASKQLAKEKVNYAGNLGKLLGSSNGVSLISQIAILFHAGFLYSKGWVSFGVVGTAQYFASNIFAGLTGFTANLGELQALNPIFAKFTQQMENADTRLMAEIPPVEKISLHDVSYPYGGSEKPILPRSFSLEKGKKYALVGDSGSGKSTLLNILAGRLPDYTGEISWNGEDFKTILRNNGEKEITYLPQNPHIFNESLLDNITLGGEISKEKLQDILEKVGLDSFIATLPQGLETILKEDGENISGGQRQRIAFARSLAAKGSLFLVDEGTSALDKESAEALENLLLKDPTITLLLVSHHLTKETQEKFTEVFNLN